MRANWRGKAAGFSLIELLIVVAIILIIAAIAIPNMVRARISANEAAAVTSIHAINTSEIAYSAQFPSIGYSPSLLALGQGLGPACPGSPVASCYLDTVLAAGTKSGYVFTYVQDATLTPSAGYTLHVDPLVPGATGQRHFYSDQQNMTHYNTTAVAGPADPAL